MQNKEIYSDIRKIKTQNLVAVIVPIFMFVMFVVLLFKKIPIENKEIIMNLIFYIGGLSSGVGIHLFGGRKQEDKVVNDNRSQLGNL
jgi:predicted permease